jgi:hypothetical protein
MQWTVGLLLVVMCGRALAQETPASREEMEAPSIDSAYDQAIVKFNTDIKNFPSWEAFRTEVLARMAPGTMGRCYERTSSSMNPTQITSVPFQRVEEDGWQKTSGKGWRKSREDRTFIEYRVNASARRLLRIEGVKVWLLGVQTHKICEFPL